MWMEHKRKQNFSSRCAQPHCKERFATPEEVAAMVVYACSPLSAATNGAALRVDGGVVKSIT